MLIDFIKQKDTPVWRVSNDDVMGGISTGEIVFSDTNTFFKGTISLANNGGFSSVFKSIDTLQSNVDKVQLTVSGDGLCYQIRLVAAHNDQRVYYCYEFDTQAHQLQTIDIRLSDFQATFRGQKVKGAPRLKSEHIEEIGFLITKKQAGNFCLSLVCLSFS